MATPGRYRIDRKIADGGMAEIFLGTQHGAEGFRRPVVLKRILQTLLADPQFRNMMIDEAHVAMGLNHSNIVQVLDLGRSKDRYFLVLELVDGWDLNQLLFRVKAANHPLPPEIALYIVAEVCRALSYAHAVTRDGKHLGIVHRDISPHNVLISEQGEVKLTDFGIAKALGRREHTGQGIIKGKLAYMSPEQASGRDLDARSDLFSVGTLLYQMVTGRRPFDGPTDLETILRVRECTFPPATEAKPDIAPKLADIIHHAMKAAPGARYQSAEEMLIDLESAQRTVFRPAGQTELKRWLAELGQKDHVPTITMARTEPSATGIESPDLADGADLVFEDTGEQRAAALQKEASAPTVFEKVIEVQPGPSTGTIELSAPGDLRRRIVLGLIAAGAVATAVVVWMNADDPVSPVAPTAKAPPPPPPVVASPDARPAAIVAAPTPDAAPEVALAEDDEEEETLLKLAEPDVDKAVIGEAEEPPPPRVAPKQASAKKPPVATTVSVQLRSKPAGAVVRMKNRVFGRAPLNLRFKSGITYEVSFVKKGYVTTSKRFTVTKKTHAVSVTLKKKPAPRPRKSFLKSLFGG